MNAFIKKNFKKDASGKSDAFFLKKNVFLNKNFLKNFMKYASKKKKNIRICCHDSKKNKLHNMLNVMFKKNNELSPHKHLRKDEIYNIILGEIEITIFKKKRKKIILNKNNQLIRVPKNTFHLVKSITNFSIFHEIRLGPFIKNDSIYKINK
jgi:cupin fold WbuC family metalloprotein